MPLSEDYRKYKIMEPEHVVDTKYKSKFKSCEVKEDREYQIKVELGFNNEETGYCVPVFINIMENPV